MTTTTADWRTLWLIVHMANQRTKLEVSSLSHSRYILGGVKILKWV